MKPPLLILTFLIFCQAASGQTTTRVVIDHEGWELVGDLVLPEAGDDPPVVLLLNQAAGERSVYEEMAEHLASRGIASLRLDLPGHGESTNLGPFVPGDNRRDPKIWDAERAVSTVVRYLQQDDRLDGEHIAIVGASYSGEEMAETGRNDGYVLAYVALSPGSFSDESVQGIDASDRPWLFVTARDERFLQEIRADVVEQSTTVELVTVPGAGHATNLLGEHPTLAERIAVWLAARLN